MLAGPRLPTCDVDIVVERCQGEAPLVVVGEVRERHPATCQKERQRVGGQSRGWVLTQLPCHEDRP